MVRKLVKHVESKADKALVRSLRGRVPVSVDVLSEVERDALIHLKKNAKSADDIVNAGVTLKDLTYIPRGFAVDRGYGPGVMTTGAAMQEMAPIQLRPYQVSPVNSVCKLVRPGYGCYLVAPCGSGKTVCGLEIARRLGRATIVLVPQSILVDQWVERAREHLPGAKVAAFDPSWGPDHGYDLVVLLVQSVFAKKLQDASDELLDSFGTVLMDEGHRYGSDLWSMAIGHFRSAYRVVLSATPDRRDGMEALIQQHVGDAIVQIKASALPPTAPPLVYLYEWRSTFERRSYFCAWSRDATISRMQSKVAMEEGRNKMLADAVSRAYRSGRKILILCSRRDQVAFFVDYLRGLVPEDDVSPYIGGTKREVLEAAYESAILVATIQIAKEGFDKPELDTLVLASPMVNVTQAVGRILRAHPDKRFPVIMDVDDFEIPEARQMLKARKALYAKEGISDVRTVRTA